tara:strand:- start:773 stop:1486 length:714 start_codon:yes stop_codon:yes gene_type:complete
MSLNVKQRNHCLFGGYCSIIAGFCYLILTIFAFLLPESIATYIASDQYFKDFKEIKIYFFLLKFFHSAANLAMIGVVSTFSMLCRDKHHAIVNWCSTIAIIGYAIGIFQNIQDVSIIPHLAHEYEISNAVLQKTILAIGVSNPFLFIISLGLPGIWFIVISYIGYFNDSIPKLLIILGFLWGFGNILTAIAHAFIIINLIYLVALGAFIFAPLWGVLEGLFLFKLVKSEKNWGETLT